MDWEFFDDPAELLVEAGAYLAADPVLGTVPASIAERYAAHRELVLDRYWWAVLRDAGEVVGLAMSTAPVDARPTYLMPVPDAAARLLARRMHERGHRPGGVNGALPAARVCAEEVARLTGGVVRVAQQTRLWELGNLLAPAAVPGRLRPVTETDLELAGSWFAAFLADADAQAGRGRGPHEAPAPADLLRRARSGRTYFWEDEDGTPVHMTGSNAPAFGVARVGPVYTPPQQRGRGWASAAVHAVSAGLLAEGARVCLFTDRANPVSNAIYARLGFEPVVDMVNLLVA